MEMNLRNILIVLVFLGVLIGGIVYLKNKNIPPQVELGDKVVDQGADHVTDIYGIKYNSNPPTSGPHFPVWAKEGLYTQLISDGYFIHSLEHGYIIMWYNCDKLSTSFLVKEVSAHEENEIINSINSGELLMHMEESTNSAITWITPQTQPKAEVQLPLSFTTKSCSNFVEELKPFLNTAQRVIITPRVNMDNKLTLTAWNRILRLDNVDKEKIEGFVQQYHNKGPEKTIE